MIGAKSARGNGKRQRANRVEPLPFEFDKFEENRMKTRHSRRRPALIILASAALAFVGAQVRAVEPAQIPGTVAQAPQQSLSVRSDAAGGVTVKVTPRSLSADSPTWDFEIVLDTHSADLGQDLLKSAALIDARGRTHAPIAWIGDPPGGHHREGVLSFKPLRGNTDSMTLRIRGVGGISQRNFSWPLKQAAHKNG